MTIVYLKQAIEKSEILNSYFLIFTHEDQTCIPYKCCSHFHTNFTVKATGVEKLLFYIDRSKAAGPDEILPQLAEILAFIFNKLLLSRSALADLKITQCHTNLQKEAILKPKPTGQLL